MFFYFLKSSTLSKKEQKKINKFKKIMSSTPTQVFIRPRYRWVLVESFWDHMADSIRTPIAPPLLRELEESSSSKPIRNLFMSSGIQTATHPYHLIDPSFLPLSAAFAAFLLTSSSAGFFHGWWGFFPVFIGLVSVLTVMFLWFKDVIKESTEGFHTTYVQRGLRQGMILFIVSEVMVFFSAFWAFFNASLHPTIGINSIWPPAGIDVVHPFHIPLINTLILLLSGFTVTYAHHGIVAGKLDKLTKGLTYTITLAIFFTLLQGYEYLVSPFTMSDGIYGSVFYALTGLHGLHVIIGTIILTTCFFLRHNYSKKAHVGLECGIWYWHFVDVVWLILYICVYCSVINVLNINFDQEEISENILFLKELHNSFVLKFTFDIQ